MTDNNKLVDFYAKMISEQIRKENGGYSLSESEAKAAKAYASHAKLVTKGYDDLKLDHGDGFFHKDNDMADRTYIIKHASGKHSMTDIDHNRQSDKAAYEAQSRMQNSHLTDAEHKEVADIIHKNSD